MFMALRSVARATEARSPQPGGQRSRTVKLYFAAIVVGHPFVTFQNVGQHMGRGLHAFECNDRFLRYAPLRQDASAAYGTKCIRTPGCVSLRRPAPSPAGRERNRFELALKRHESLAVFWILHPPLVHLRSRLHVSLVFVFQLIFIVTLWTHGRRSPSKLKIVFPTPFESMAAGTGQKTCRRCAASPGWSRNSSGRPRRHHSKCVHRRESSR
jgi:hypothetical protein